MADETDIRSLSSILLPGNRMWMDVRITGQWQLVYRMLTG